MPAGTGRSGSGGGSSVNSPPGTRGTTRRGRRRSTVLIVRLRRVRAQRHDATVLTWVCAQTTAPRTPLATCPKRPRGSRGAAIVSSRTDSSWPFRKTGLDGPDPDRGGAVHPPTSPTFCRVTVLSPGRRVDLALPCDVPMAELNPLVLELLGEPARSPTRPEPWRFSAVTGTPLPAGATLAELGVLDGETLRLGTGAPPPPAPAFDDPVDALAALTPRRRHGRRGPEIAAVGLTLAAAAL